MEVVAPFTGRKMLFSVVAFFAVVIAANLVMMSFALSTHTGLVTPNSYVASQDFNKRIADARAQATLGWRSTADYDAGTVSVRFQDRDGAPVDGLTIAGVLGRPVTAADDREVAFRRSAPGAYRVDAVLGPGEWRLELVAHGPDGRDMRQIYDLFVPAARK